MMELVFVKVSIKGYERPQKTLREDIFRYYFEELGYSRKKFTALLKLNHRVFTNGIRAYYGPEHIEELRLKKIVRSNLGGRISKWEDKLKAIDVFQPGFSELFSQYIKTDPTKIMLAIVDLNDKFYKAKLAIRPIKKYANQAISRLGGDRVKLVGNGLEAKVKFILDDLDITYECQFKLGKYFYDFKVNNTLIEVDGAQYHGGGLSNDIPKEKLAKKCGFNLLRLTDDEIKKQPLKIKKCLQQLKK